jgi:hypothetical protein
MLVAPLFTIEVSAISIALEHRRKLIDCFEIPVNEAPPLPRTRTQEERG